MCLALVHSWQGFRVLRKDRRLCPELSSPNQGYLPANSERRKLTLQRKREEYFGFIQQYYDSRNEEHHQDTYRQVGTLLLPSSSGDSLSSLLLLLVPTGGVMPGLALAVAWRSLLFGEKAPWFCPC